MDILANMVKEMVRGTYNLSGPEAASEILRMSVDEDVRYRWMAVYVASSDILVTMAGDGGVRYSVAQNPSTPLGVLSKLLKDEDKSVRDVTASMIKKHSAQEVCV